MSQDLKERPRRIQFKDDVVRELLPETNAVEEEKREEEVEKKKTLPDFSIIVGKQVNKTCFKGENGHHFFLVDGEEKELSKFC